MTMLTVKDLYKPFRRPISKKVKCLDRTDKKNRKED
jgi:hypothetical protein